MNGRKSCFRRFARLGAAVGAFLLFAAGSCLAEEAPVSGIAMHGTPKYGVGFTHFDYANPDAPQGGVLRLGAVGSFDSLNPFIVRGQPPQGLGLGNMALVYESLMARSWDEPFSLYGLIAESIEVPEDRSSITFHLHPQAHWQDGQPITADDVMFSLTTLSEQGRPNHRTYYRKVEKAEEICCDKRSVKFSFRRNPDGSIDREMPLIMGLMPILPKHDWQDRNFNQPTLRVPVGSGPYKIAKVDIGRSITYERDPNYWGRDVPAQKGLYNFSTIRFDYYRDDGIALQAFKAGQYDLRREPNPNKWATAYDVPAVHDGRLKLEKFEHHRPEAAYGFVLNTRRALFQDKALREALSYTFDFGWINRSLFHGVYKRTESFFPNSELAASGVAQGRELELLGKVYHESDIAVPCGGDNRMAAHILHDSIAIPSTDGSEESLRANLLKAADILKAAGYVLKDGKLYAPDGGGCGVQASEKLCPTPLSFEILLSDPSEEKVALEWARALRRIGIEAKPRTVDSAQYQARLTGFDYDVTTARWFNTLSPGNEQVFFWGSAAARQNGSRNYAGVNDPAVDALAGAIPSATSREELVAATRALDRVLLAGNYVIPFYHLGFDPIAWWTTRLDHPEVTPVYGAILESWWAR